MNYLVTGGAGFIGSSLADKLLEEGNTVICLDNFDNFYDPEIKKRNIANALKNKNYTLIEGDIRDKNALEKCFSVLKIDTVIHLAALAGVRPSIANPELYFQVNLFGTLNILEAMRKFQVNKMIFSSSSSIYGNNPKVPFSETDRVDNPISPYAASKKSAELLCHNYHHLYGFDICCLRFFTVYGPRQRPEMAIHLFTKKIHQGQAISVFGDGTNKRDYTFIGDILNGITASILNNDGYEIINLGESFTIALNDLVELIEKELGKKAVIERKPMQPGDVNMTYADVSKAKKNLNYIPSTPINNGIKKFVEWYLKENT